MSPRLPTEPADVETFRRQLQKNWRRYVDTLPTPNTPQSLYMHERFFEGDGARSRDTSRPETAAASPLMTLQEMAVYLRVSLRTAYQLAYDGEVPAVKVGQQWRIPRAELERQLGISPTRENAT